MAGRPTRSKDRRRERGVVMVFAALAATSLILFAALAMDVGLVWSSRTQSQGVADAAALAAAANLIDAGGTSVTTDAALSAAQTYAAANSTVGNPSVTVTGEDVVFGSWDLGSRNFDTGVDLDDLNLVTAVQVEVRMDGEANNASPVFLSRVIGVEPFDVVNRSVAYLGFQGEIPAPGIDLPVVIDACDITGDGCSPDFCSTVATPPYACPLDQPQVGDGDVTCLDYNDATPLQNACWTVFDESGPLPGGSAGTDALIGVVDDGNTDVVEAGAEVYLDDRDTTTVQTYISDKFYGSGPFIGNPAGEDRYFPYESPARSDSWVVKLPVADCPSREQCGGSGPVPIVGTVCFEIREIDLGDRLIRGRFLCPSSGDTNEQQLFAACMAAHGAPAGPGGCNFGVRASRAVLVD